MGREERPGEMARKLGGSQKFIIDTNFMKFQPIRHKQLTTLPCLTQQLDDLSSVFFIPKPAFQLSINICQNRSSECENIFNIVGSHAVGSCPDLGHSCSNNGALSLANQNYV